jgi:hypothetical protein
MLYILMPKVKSTAPMSHKENADQEHRHKKEVLSDHDALLIPVFNLTAG